MSTSSVHSFIHLREIQDDMFCLVVPGSKKWDFRAVIGVGSLSFNLLSDGEQEAILEAFRALLMRLNFDVLIHIRIKPYNLSSYLDQFHNVYDNDEVAALARDHEQFSLTYTTIHSLLQREFYIVVSADEQPDKSQSSLDAAKSLLDMRCADICRDLDRIGLVNHRLKDEDLANYYSSILHSQNAEENPLRNATLAGPAILHLNTSLSHEMNPTKELTTQAAETHALIESMLLSQSRVTVFLGRVLTLEERLRARNKRRKNRKADLKENAHTGDVVRLAELIQPSAIEVKRTYLRINQVYDEYVRFFAIIGYPRQVANGWLDKLCSIDEPLDLCLHISPLDAQTYIQKLTRKLVSFSGTQKVTRDRGQSPDPYISNAMQDVEELRDKLVRQEEQIYGVALYLLVRTNTKSQLDERTRRLYSQLRSLDLRAIPLTLRQQKGLQCFLPGRDALKMRRLLDTSSILTAFPFTDNHLTTERGVIRGVTPNKSLVILDPFDTSFENGHECTIGPSGSGKSFAKKVTILRSIASGMYVTVLDPEGEYLKLTEHVNGKVINLASGNFQLNPFRLFLRGGDETAILNEKIQSLHVLFDLLLAEKGEVLKQDEKSYLSKCIAYVYRDDVGLEPSMYTFYQVLSTGTCGPDLYHLGDRLERFVSMFPVEETEDITLSAPLLVFNMRDLEDDMRDVGVFLVTMAFWSRIRKQQPHERKPRMLVIDETWRFLKLSTSAEFLVYIIRLARKHYLCVHTNIHDATEFFVSEWGRAIWVNSALKFVMKQSSSTINTITEILDLSAGERRYLLSCGIGAGLMCARGIRVPMYVVASDLEFDLANTNASQVSRQEVLETV